jgi:hypothetical protein
MVYIVAPIDVNVYDLITTKAEIKLKSKILRHPAERIRFLSGKKGGVLTGKCCCGKGIEHSDDKKAIGYHINKEARKYCISCLIDKGFFD